MITRTLISLLCGLAAGLYAQETNAPARLDLQSFRIISDRNIFNPNRASRASQNTRREREPERRVRTESLSLLGTMSYEKGWFAFFDGSNSEYRRALQPNDAIAGYKIAVIAPNHVRLEATNSPPVELKVGMQMKKQDEGEWEVSRYVGSAPATQPASTEAEPASGTAASDGESDVIKRLMQQREQELKK